MKDSLLLPVQSNGGNRHIATSSTNSGETYAALHAVRASQTPAEDFPATAFADTYNKALQLSDEDIAKITRPEENGPKLAETKTELSFLAPPQDSMNTANTPLNKHYIMAEKVVDAATPLAIAQFTQSDTETIAFAKTSSETISLQNGEKIDRLEIIAELPRLPVLRDDVIGVDSGFAKDHLEAPDTPINLFDTRNFEIIKGQNVATLSYPHQDAPHHFRGVLTQEDVQRLIANTSPSTHSELPQNIDAGFETLTPVIEGTEGIEKLPSSTSILPLNQGILGDLWVSSETPSAILMSRPVPESITFYHPSSAERIISEDSIHNFRGVLTQQDIQGVFEGSISPNNPQGPQNTNPNLEFLTPVIDSAQSAKHPSVHAPILTASKDISANLLIAPDTANTTSDLIFKNNEIAELRPENPEDTIHNFRGVLSPEGLQGFFGNLTPSGNSNAPQDIEAGLETLSPIIDGAEGADFIEDLTVSINFRADVVEDAVEPIINDRRIIPAEGQALEQNNDDDRAPDKTLMATNLDVTATDLSDIKASASASEIQTVDTPQSDGVDSALVASAPHDNKQPETPNTSDLATENKDIEIKNSSEAPQTTSRPTVGNDNVAPDLPEPDLSGTASFQTAPEETLTVQDNDAPVKDALDTPLTAENETIPLEDGQIPDVAAIQTPVQGLALNPIEEVSIENNRGTVSLSDIQLAANRPVLASAVDTGKKTNPRDTREIDLDIDVEVDTSSSDIRDVEIQTDEIDPSDLYFDQIDSEFETAKSLPQVGQTALSPLAMSTTSSPIFQPIMGLGGEAMSPLAAQAQSLSSSSSTLAQSPNVRQAVVTSVSEAILTAKETPKGIVVQLDPPEMGRVYIDFLFEGDNNVTVVMKSESADSQAILKERQDHFQALLKDSGFENITMSFEQQSSSDGEGSSSDGQGKDINIGLSGQSLDDQSDSYKQPIYQVTGETIRLDMRL